ncbi:MAG: ABC transporter permease [Aestuariivirga sp.]
MTDHRTGLVRGVAITPGAARRFLQMWGPLIALAVLSLGFTFADPNFATPGNLQAIASRSAIPMVLVIGMTFVVIQGSIDLSVEGVMAVCSMSFALTVLNNRTGLDFGLLGGAAAILGGAALGLLNGVVVVHLRVPSFMVTLGMWSFTYGIAMLLSGGEPPLIRDEMLRAFGLGSSLGIPNLVFLAVLCLAAGYVLQAYTRFGRYSYMIGGGEDLTRLSGIPVDRYKVMVFALSGLMAGLAGVMESARIGVGHSEIGPGQMFAAITALVIGGTALSGGRGGVLHSAIGVLILSVLGSGMVFLGISPYLQKAVQGAIILIAVIAATWHLRSRLRVVK